MNQKNIWKLKKKLEEFTKPRVSQVDVSRTIDRLLKAGISREEIKAITGLSERQVEYYLSLMGKTRSEKKHRLSL